MPWIELDNNDQTVGVAAPDELYQLHRDGSVWFYTGVPLTGWTRYANAPATVEVVAGAPFARDVHGGIWQHYFGLEVDPPNDPWGRIDDNPNTVEIAGAGGRVYQRHADGSIWRYDGVTPMTGWERIFSGSGTAQIAVSPEFVYRLGADGAVQRYVGKPTHPWIGLDDNAATTRIAVAGTSVFQLHADGGVWMLGPHDSGWAKLDDNPATVDIVAGDGPGGMSLFQRHTDGSVWGYTGVPLTGWNRLDDDPRTVQVVASGGALYQRHQLGSIWVLTDTG